VSEESTTLQGCGMAGQDECVLGHMCDDPETHVHSASFDWTEQFRRASMLLSTAVLTSVFFDSTGYPLSHIQIAKRWLE
jgi:hypothetical protein